MVWPYWTFIRRGYQYYPPNDLFQWDFHFSSVPTFKNMNNDGNPKGWLILIIINWTMIWLSRIWSTVQMILILSWVLLIMVLMCMMFDKNIHLKTSFVLLLPMSVAQHFLVIYPKWPLPGGLPFFFIPCIQTYEKLRKLVLRYS